MSRSMRVFCLLAAIGMIVGSVWLYLHDMKGQAFGTAVLFYILGCIVLIGEVWSPLSKELPNRPYRGESRDELIRRDMEDWKRARPNSKWPVRYGVSQALLILGFFAWIAMLSMLFY